MNLENVKGRNRTKYMVRLLKILVMIPLVSSAYGQDIFSKYSDVISSVNEINQDSSLTIVVLKNEEFLPHMTDGGGQLTGYFKNRKVQKMTRSIGLSYGIETYDYYFRDGKLFFVYETLNSYLYIESSGKFDYSKTERNFTGRYYFKDDRLFDSETTGHNRFEDDTIDIETTLLKEMSDCLNMITNYKR